MRRFLTRCLLLAVFAVVPLAKAQTLPASGGDAPPAANAGLTDDPTEEQAAEGLRQHHRHHHHGGIALFVALSLDTMGIDDARRSQVEKVRGDLHACMATSRAAEKQLLGVLADGVATGAVDTTKVDNSITQIGSAASGVHGCAAAALNQLHAILTPAERVVLTDKARAHYQVWRQVNHEAVPGGQEKNGRLADLAVELNLPADEIAKLSTALSGKFAGPRASKFEPEKAEAHLQAFITAFDSETFEAHNLPLDANAHLATHGARRMALFYETVAPILTSDQRSQLAEHLRQDAAREPTTAANP